MDRFRQRTFYYSSCVPPYCEPLERRVLLDGDPVIVFTEAFSLTTFEGVDIDSVSPWLWKSPLEYAWNLDRGDWDTNDGDENGYADDAYGWNFSDGPLGSPNIVDDDDGGHGAAILGSVLPILNGAESQADRVRIMHVIGTGSQITDYVVGQKALGVNIVGVSNSKQFGEVFSRADAKTLGESEILLFVGSNNNGLNRDSNPASPSSPSFYHATPRAGTGLPAVQTIIPVTTDPEINGTDYGINSFYFASPGVGAQSWAVPIASTYAGIAVQAYQDAHGEDSPSAQQIKRAMMSGLTYKYFEDSELDRRTITHDYVDGFREGMGILDLSNLLDSINDPNPGITDVAITQISEDSLGTTVLFQLHGTGSISNWTISWGDNSNADQSGVEVVDGDVFVAEHKYHFQNIPHHYFPTIYAMSGTKQVYLPAPSAQAEVVIDKWAPTSGQDNYTLSRNGSNVTLSLQNGSGTISESFTPGAIPSCIIALGEGGDTMTIDFSNDDPLASMDLNVYGSEGNIVRVIGSAGADTISAFGTTVSVNGHSFTAGGTAAVYVDGAGGGDILSVTAPREQATIHIDSSQTFSEVSVGKGRIIVDQAGDLMLRTGLLDVQSNGFIDLNDNFMIVDYDGTSPLEEIQALLTAGYNGGDWDGSGIRTSLGDPINRALGFVEASDIFSSFPATFGGDEDVDDESILIRYTYYGDTDLTGGVGLNDFNRLAGNFGLSDRRWVHGDFNFDTQVNLNDFNLLAANFGSGGGGNFASRGGGDDFDDDPDDTYGYTVEDLRAMLPQ